MRTRPEISDESIATCLRAQYGLQVSQARFLPIGADVNSAVFSVAADDGRPYFLKLRRGSFAEVTVAVPAFLHAQGIRRVMVPIATTAGQLWVHADDFVWILGMVQKRVDTLSRRRNPVSLGNADCRRSRAGNGPQEAAPGTVSR